MERRHIHSLDDHGDLLEGWFLRILTWISVLSMRVGIIGANLRMKGVLAFMSTGIPFYFLHYVCLCSAYHYTFMYWFAGDLCLLSSVHIPLLVWQHFHSAVCSVTLTEQNSDSGSIDCNPRSVLKFSSMPWCLYQNTNVPNRNFRQQLSSSEDYFSGREFSRLCIYKQNVGTRETSIHA